MCKRLGAHVSIEYIRECRMEHTLVEYRTIKERFPRNQLHVKGKRHFWPSVLSLSLSLSLSRTRAYIKITIIGRSRIDKEFAHLTCVTHGRAMWCYFTLQTPLIVNHLILRPAVNVPFYRTPITVMQAQCSSRHLPAAPHRAPSRLSNVTNWRRRFKSDFRFFYICLHVRVYVCMCGLTASHGDWNFEIFRLDAFSMMPCHLAIHITINIDVNLINERHAPRYRFDTTKNYNLRIYMK